MQTHPGAAVHLQWQGLLSHCGTEEVEYLWHFHSGEFMPSFQAEKGKVENSFCICWLLIAFSFK